MRQRKATPGTYLHSRMPMHARVALPHTREKSADNPSSTCERCDCQQAGPRHGGTTLLYLRGLMGTSATLISCAVFPAAFAPAPASMRAADDRILSPASDSAHTAVLGRHAALSPRPDSAGRRFDALGLAWKALPGERVNAQTSTFRRLGSGRHRASWVQRRAERCASGSARGAVTRPAGEEGRAELTCGPWADP
jgi:hypothetical protein